MLCPNCEQGEMSNWAGRAVCSSCGYAIGSEPPKRVVVIADDLQEVNEKAINEFRRKHHLLPSWLRTDATRGSLT